MASPEAICRIRVEGSALHEEQIRSSTQKEHIPAQDRGDDSVLAPAQSEADKDLVAAQYTLPAQSTADKEDISAKRVSRDNSILPLGKEPLPRTAPIVPFDDVMRVPIEIRNQWAKSISDQILNQRELNDDRGVRDWDFVLRLDGSVENVADNALPSPPSTILYPAPYRIPWKILERLGSSQEKVQRAEIFALGSLLYEVYSGMKMLNDPNGGENGDYIQSCFVKEEFPENVWELDRAKRILACWCPGFARDILRENSSNQTVISKVANYVKKHPILFGVQVVGGIFSLASLVALPVLGAVGFGAAGPIAGSAAAAWQSGLGIVEAGSLFAWCQSAAMGGAAVGGILATGLAGVGATVGAAVAGALDDVATPAPDLKEKFLIAWRRDIGEPTTKTAVSVKL